MDPVIKTGWLANLRSGKYLQGTGFLRMSNCQDKFCCLGVLQDQVAPEEWINPEADHSGWSVPHLRMADEYGEDSQLIEDNEGELSAAMLERVGITPKEQEQLMHLNDGKKWSNAGEGFGQSKESPDFCKGHEPQHFHAIADWIEKNL